MAKNGRPNKPNNTKVRISRQGSADESYGPKTAGNVGAKADDGAGTRERAGLPPETRAMKAPKAALPAAAQKMASTVLPVPGVDDSLINVVEPWDFQRDRGHGSSRSPKGRGPNSAGGGSK
jgi:hypothetical protein